MYVALQQTGDLFRVSPASCSMVAGTGSSSPVTLTRISGREWTDSWIYLVGIEKSLCQKCIKVLSIYSIFDMREH